MLSKLDTHASCTHPLFCKLFRPYQKGLLWTWKSHNKQTAKAQLEKTVLPWCPRTNGIDINKLSDPGIAIINTVLICSCVAVMNCLTIGLKGPNGYCLNNVMGYTYCRMIK